MGFVWVDVGDADDGTGSSELSELNQDCATSQHSLPREELTTEAPVALHPWLGGEALGDLADLDLGTFFLSRPASTSPTGVRPPLSWLVDMAGDKWVATGSITPPVADEKAIVHGEGATGECRGAGDDRW